MALRQLLLLCFLFTGIASFGAKTDSLELVLKSDLPDSMKMIHSLRLMNEEQITDRQVAERYYSRLENFLTGRNGLKLMGMVYEHWATYYRIRNDYSTALIYANKRIRNSETLRDSTDLIVAYRYVATGIYSNLDLEDEAVKALHKGISYTRPGSPQRAAMYYILGWMEFNMRRYEPALDHLKRSYAEGIKAKMTPPEMIEFIGWVGNAYGGVKDYKNAIAWRKKALAICEGMKYDYGVADCKRYLGQFYYSMQQYDSAIYYSSSAFLYAKAQPSNGSRYGMIYNGMTLINACIKANKPAMAEPFVKDLTDTSLIKVYYGDMTRAIFDDLLAKFYTAKGDEAKTIYYLKDYIRAKDSADVSKQSVMVSEALLKTNFEKEQQESLLLQQKKDLETEAQATRQRIIIIAVIVVLALVLLLLGMSYKSVREKRASLVEIGKQKQEIEHQKEMVDEKNKEIIESITYAKRLQEAILPPHELIGKKLPQSFVLYQPKDIVAGDFYWMEESGDKLFIAAADSTGHGVPGALVSIVCSNALNRSVKEFGLSDPGAILDKTRELVLETFSKSEDNVRDGMDISLLCIHPALPGSDEVQLTWSGANNPLWYIQRESATLMEIKGDKQPIGLSDAAVPFTSHHLSLQRNDTVFLFTDGFADQFGGPKGKKFKYKPLQELLLAIADKNPATQKEELLGAFHSWKGSLEQVDDVCMIGIRI